MKNIYQTIFIILLVLTSITMSIAIGLYIGQELNCNCKPKIITIDNTPKCTQGQLICVQTPD
jgi:hypothetical protein